MAEDDDLFEDENEDTGQPAVDNKDAIIQRLQRDKEKFQDRLKKAEEAAYAKARTQFEREAKAVEIAAELGVKPGISTRWLNENPEADPSKEALATYATEEFGLTVTTESETESPAEKQPPAAAAFHAGAGTPSGGEFYSADEVRKIGLRDQAEALRIIAEGRMKTDA